jgi:hypothetical protein
MSEHDDRSSGRRSKVARVINDYALEGMGELLERSWLGEGEPERSLRALADHFNRSVLEARMREAGLNPLDGEVDNMYRLLTDDDVSAGHQAEAVARLEREGIDPETLRGDFVSHQAIHTYLTKHRQAEFPTPDEGDRTASALDTILSTRGRLDSVVTQTLENLARSGTITLGDPDVTVSVTVYCDECESQYEVGDLLDRGGCDCE